MIVGRLREGGELAHYQLSDEVVFVGFPYYESLASPLAAARGTLRSLTRFWRAIDDVDACWLLGPHPLSLAFVAIAALRGRRIFLGVRQDLPAYARSRHPGRPAIAAAALLLDACYRLLSKRFPTVVVGPALRRRYHRATRLLEIAVSLVRPEDILDVDTAVSRSYAEEMTLLSVGRIDEEKNPMMLAEVFAALCAADRRWRLLACGEGQLAARLQARLTELGVADRADLRGYVDHAAMAEIYRTSHALVHTSLTEGLPQVIIEALAAGLPVVATDVGGVAEAVGHATLVVPSGDVDAAVDALQRVADEPDLRLNLAAAGTDYARRHTLEAEVERVVELLER